MSKKKKPVKPDGAISELQKEIDSFKFQIDDLCNNELPHLGAASPDRLNVYKRTTGLKAELSALDQKLNGLSLSDAEISTKKFEAKKNQEKHRLDSLKRKLDDISEQLEPDEVEEDYFRTLSVTPTADETDVTDDHNDKAKKKQNKFKHEVIDDDEDDEDEEDEYEETESDEYVTEDEESVAEDGYIECYAEGLTTFNGEQAGDLAFTKGDHLMIIQQSDDGWWTARNEAGDEGVVPSTLIKVVDERDLGMSTQKQNADVQVSRESKKRSGKELWNKLKEKKPATNKETSIHDVLKAMKAIPSGFRNPTLGHWYQKDDYKISSWVVPKLSPSNLQFKDLNWDVINKKIRQHPVNLSRTFSLVSVRCIPPIGAGVEVLSRHVYIALWDEEKILSNIHLIRAVPLERDLSWTFTPKVGKNVPSLYDGDFIARTNIDDRKLSVLFEFNYTYRRTSNSKQNDICCGWASLPLFELDGTALPNRNFELKINGGTPFEKDVPLDPTLNLGGSTSLMQSLVRSNQEPRVLVKATSINKSSKEIYDMLPETIVTCQRYAPFIGYYRFHAAMVHCREDDIPSEYICDAILAYFPRALAFPDLMDALKIVWEEKSKTTLSRTQRKNLGQLVITFKQSFTESAFGLMQCANIPIYVWADGAIEKARQEFIQTFLQRKDSHGNLLSPDYRFKPLDINKLSFNAMSKNSIDAPLLNRQCLVNET